MVNEIRGLRHAYGMVLPQGLTRFRPVIPSRSRNEPARRTALSTEGCWPRYDALLSLEKRLAYSAEKLAAIGRARPECPRLQTIPGMWPVSATAILAAISDATPLKHGRPFAAWLGLVPRAPSAGGQPRLLGSSTRGDGSRRPRSVHGARVPRRWVDLQEDDRRRWLTRAGPGTAKIAPPSP